MEKIKKCPCGNELAVNSGNSDSNCHRQRPSYSAKLASESNYEICKGCPYNSVEIAEQALKDK